MFSNDYTVAQGKTEILILTVNISKIPIKLRCIKIRKKSATWKVFDYSSQHNQYWVIGNVIASHYVKLIWHRNSPITSLVYITTLNYHEWH